MTAAMEREHFHYVGDPLEECIEDCPGCHFAGNTECSAYGDCDICDEPAEVSR